MNISLNINSFCLENLFFLEKKQNIVMNGFFTKIVYSDKNIIFNSVFLGFKINVDSEKNITTTTASSSPFIKHNNTSFPKKTWKTTTPHTLKNNKIHFENIGHITTTTSVFFLTETNLFIIQKLIEIENKILNFYKQYFQIKKNNEYLLKNQLNKGFLKLFQEPRFLQMSSSSFSSSFEEKNDCCYWISPSFKVGMVL